MRISAGVRQLFERDDGSLPDIHVCNLTSEQIVLIYEWLMSQCSIARDPTLWNIALDQDVPIRETSQPARAFVSGTVASFRHCLANLSIDGVALPELSVCLEDGGLSFDYRMGPEWGDSEVQALLELFTRIMVLAPNAAISRTDEGVDVIASPEFATALAEQACARES